jgi:ribonuclease HI
MAVPEVNILQWNARSIKANQNALAHYLESHPNFSVLAISETHLHNADTFKLLNLVSFRADRIQQRGGGAALFVHPLLPAERIDLHTPLEAVAIQVNYKGVKTTIMSIYVPPNENKNKELDNLISQIPHPAIICGDLNAHLLNHGSTQSNQRGRFLQKLVAQKNFTIINTDQPTLQQRPNNNPTAPDLTLVSDRLIDQLNWQVSELTLGSDHHLIQITTPAPQQSKPIVPPPPRRKFEKANWDRYTQLLQHSLPQLAQQDDEPKYDKFVQALQAAADATIPWTKPSQPNHKRPKKPWWSTECETAYRTMLLAQKAFRRDTSSIQKYIESNKKAAEFKRTSKEAKLAHWRQFCSSLTSQSNPSAIWNTTKMLKNQFNTTVSPSLAAADWEMDFLDRIAPADVPYAPPPDWQALHGTSVTQDHPFMDNAFTRTELDLALATVNVDATPGPDNISYAMLTHLPEKGKDVLVEIFNDLWERSDCPADWKKSWLKPILKAGKKPGEETSYRPILYTSCVSKLFEKLLKRRLVAFLEENQLLPKSQHGFRTGLNIQMCLADLISSAQLSLLNKQMHFALLIDVKGAFDNVPHKDLLEELHFIGLPPKLTKWLSAFFTNRALGYHSLSKGAFSRPVTKGVPQGGVLSPLLYIVYVRSLDLHIRRRLRTIQFADDALFHFSHHDMSASRKIIKETVDDLSLFFASRGLQLNASKTVVLVFSRRKTPLSPIDTLVGEVQMTDNAKYLGVLLDAQLTWKAHIQNLIHRCQMPLNIIKSIAFVWWGADPTCLLLIYKALILSKLQASSFLWQQAAKKSVQQLDLVQNISMRKILGVLPSTPIHSMQAETKLPPLKYAASKQAENLIIKLIHREHQALTNIRELANRAGRDTHAIIANPLIKAFQKWIASGIIIPSATRPPIIMPQNLREFILDTPWKLFPKNDLPPQTSQLIRHFLHTDAHLYKKWYTDGSKQSDGSTGAAFVCPDLNVQCIRRLPNSYSVFSAEAHAMLSALKYLLVYPQNQPNLICTDSKSLLDALSHLSSVDSNNFIIAEIRAILQDLTLTGALVRFLWVPAHIGIHGNEVADKLAQFSCKTPLTTSPAIPLPDLKRQISFDASIQWNTKWRLINLQKGRDFAQLCPQGHLPQKSWFSSFPGRTRSFYTSLSRLRFAHAPTPDRLFSWKIAPSPACICSFSPGTLDHLLFHCPRFASARTPLTACLGVLNIKPPYNLQTLLSTQNKQVYKTLHDLYRDIFHKL